MGGQAVAKRPSARCSDLGAIEHKNERFCAFERLPNDFCSCFLPQKCFILKAEADWPRPVRVKQAL
jgi:hypothetical protein